MFMGSLLAVHHPLLAGIRAGNLVRSAVEPSRMWILQTLLLLNLDFAFASVPVVVSPERLTMMDAGTSEWSSRVLLVQNQKDAEIGLSEVSIESDREFEVDRSQCSLIPAKGSCRLGIRHYAHRSGQFQATFRLRFHVGNDQYEELRVPLSGRAMGYCQHRRDGGAQ
jgi:hypothetical protein